MNKLLIIDDDLELYALLADYLGEQGLPAPGRRTGLSAMERLAAEPWTR